MVHVHKEIHIDAPVHKVFEFTNDANNFPEFWPSLIAAEDVEYLDNGGTRFHYVYKMAGMTFEGESEDIEVIPDQLIVNETGGGIPSNWRWQFTPDNGHTQLTLDVDYEVPGRALGKLAEPIIRKLNENDVNTMLSNLKMLMEA